MSESKGEFDDILNQISALKLMLKSICSEVKSLEKQYNKSMKKIEKANNMVKLKKLSRKTGGISLPCELSKELKDFMNLDEDKKMARTDVTKYLCEYIKTNNLQDEKDKLVINPNDKLKELFGIENEPFTYFTMQKYMNKHFIRS